MYNQTHDAVKSSDYQKAAVMFFIICISLSSLYAQDRILPPEIIDIGIQYTEMDSIGLDKILLDPDYSMENDLAFNWLGQYRSKWYHRKDGKFRDCLNTITIHYDDLNSVNIIFELHEINPDGTAMLRNRGEIHHVIIESDRYIRATEINNIYKFYIKKDDSLHDTIRTLIYIQPPTGSSYHEYSFSAKLDG